jgi:tripartite-type tricarboxylate transporter receptor subunit TctC
LKVAAAIGGFMCVAGARAESPANFYHGKTVQFLVGSAAGSGFDMTARPLAQFMSKYIPGHPSVVVVDMPGAAGVTMTNYLANEAPADGTVFGIGINDVVYEPLLHIISKDGRGIKFDPRALKWIGTPVREPQVSWVSSAANVRTWQDMKSVRTRFGSTSFAGDNAIFPSLADDLLGLKTQIVAGYPSSSEIFEAVEQGELDGSNTAYSNLTITKPDWLRQGKALIVMQFGLTRLPTMPKVPTLLELVKNPEDQQMLHFLALKFEMSRPVYAPPKIPADRLEALRMAFDKAVNDPDFIAIARRMGLYLRPLDGSSVTKIVDEITSTPTPVIDHTRQMLKTMGAGKAE